MNHKPNIVSILMDDMGWTDLACCGSNFYESPNVDRLKEQGMLFTRAYASCPVCSPTRASLMTGKYPATVGVTDWISHFGAHPCKGRLIDVPYLKHLPDSEVTIADALRQGGYVTWHVGKWHLGLEEHWPDKHGFDVNLGGCQWGKPRDGYWMPCHIPTLPDGPEGEHLTDRLTDEAIRLIRERDPEKPFYLNLCHYDVHHPYHSKREHLAYFEEKRKRMGLDQIDPFEEGEFFPVEHKKTERILRRKLHSDPVYASMIYNADWNIGRLMAVLEEEGLMDNTLVIFTSDNGGTSSAEGSPTCNAPAREGKGWMYDGGTRVPMIAVWRGHIRPGSVCDELTTTPDFYPTFLEVAGLPLRPEQHVDGVSIRSLFEETGTLAERPIFWHYPHYGELGGTPGSSVMLGQYKLIEFFEDMHVELYDIINDVSETHDLSQEMPDKAAELLNLLHDWQTRIEAKIPEANPDYIG